MTAKKKYPLYLNGFLKDKHIWSEEQELDYGDDSDDKFKAQVCTVCHAINRGYGPLYYSCGYTTSYPADEAPCLCTGRGYAEDHGLEYAPGKIYGYKDTPDKKVDMNKIIMDSLYQ